MYTIVYLRVHNLALSIIPSWAASYVYPVGVVCWYSGDTDSPPWGKEYSQGGGSVWSVCEAYELNSDVGTDERREAFMFFDFLLYLCPVLRVWLFYK